MKPIMQLSNKDNLSISSFNTVTESSKFYDIQSSPSASQYILLEIKKSTPFISQQKDFYNSLETISDKNDLISFAKRRFPKSKQYFLDLLTEAIKDFYEEEDTEISIESLKGILFFLYSLTKFKKPDISICETGLFYIDWEEEKNNSLTVRFKEDFFIEYSLFQPCEYSEKWNIRNGMVHILNFKNDLSQLGIKLHKEV